MNGKQNYFTYEKIELVRKQIQKDNPKIITGQNLGLAEAKIKGDFYIFIYNIFLKE